MTMEEIIYEDQGLRCICSFALAYDNVNYLDRQTLSIARSVLREKFGMSNETMRA